MTPLLRSLVTVLKGGRLVKGALSGLMLLASGPKAGLSILRSSNASELKL